jgi:hypothetical protein
MGTSTQAATEWTLHTRSLLSYSLYLFPFVLSEFAFYFLTSSLHMTKQIARTHTHTQDGMQNYSCVCLKLQTINLGDIPYERTKYSSKFIVLSVPSCMIFCRCPTQTYENCHIFKRFISRLPVVNLSSRLITTCERKISWSIQTTTTLRCLNSSVVEHNILLENITC